MADKDIAEEVDKMSKPDFLGKSIDYPEPKEIDKRPIGATPIKNLTEEEFLKEHPSLNLTQITKLNKGYVHIIDIHETQLDKEIVKVVVEAEIKKVEPLITPDGLNNVSAGIKMGMQFLNDKLKLGIDMSEYPNEFLVVGILSKAKVKEAFNNFINGGLDLAKFKKELNLED